VEGFTATARLLFPPSTSSPSDAQTFVDLVPVIAIPDIGPQDLILGKPWFARWTSQLTVDWQSNLVTLSFPNATFAWRAVQPTVECAASSTSVPPPPNAPDPDPYSREDLDRLILSPAQLQRLVRKPLASMFFCFVTAVPDPVVPPSPTLPDPSPPPITAADPIAVVSAATVTSASPAPPIKDASFPSGVSAQLRHVLSKYSSVFPSSLPAGLPPTRFGLEFRIDTVPGANPPASSPYRLSPPEQLELRKQLKSLVDLGYIVPTTSPYAAPVFFVVKPDRSLRLVVDWRGLNAITIKNKLALPRLDDLFHQLRTAKIFSKLDLASGFYQIPVAEADRAKTAMTTPFGSFEWRVMGMGLSNAPATFQALMTKVLGPFLGKTVVVFIDDILVFSGSEEQHLRDLEDVLAALRAHRLYAKPSKCVFCAPRIAFLGHVFEDGRMFVDDEKTAAVREWPLPETSRELRRFLGLTNFFSAFVKDYARMAAPLFDLVGLSGDRFRTAWTPVHAQAFDALKLAVTSAPSLVLPDFAVPFTVTADASDVAIGAVLAQGGHPVAFFSAKLNPAERAYSVDERETLAIVRALRHWRHYLFAHFHLYTDSRVARYILTKRSLSRRQAQWAETLSAFDFTIAHVRGSANVADPLSRRPDYAPSPDDREPPRPLYAQSGAALDALLSRTYATCVFVSSVPHTPPRSLGTKGAIARWPQSLARISGQGSQRLFALSLAAVMFASAPSQRRVPRRALYSPSPCLPVAGTPFRWTS
jgi:hypothetical protein